jgi:hypothetical protein
MKDKLKKHMDDYGTLYLVGGCLAAVTGIYYAFTRTLAGQSASDMEVRTDAYKEFLLGQSAATISTATHYNEMMDADILRIQSKTKSH